MRGERRHRNRADEEPDDDTSRPSLDGGTADERCDDEADRAPEAHAAIVEAVRADERFDGSLHQVTARPPDDVADEEELHLGPGFHGHEDLLAAPLVQAGEDDAEFAVGQRRAGPRGIVFRYAFAN